MTTCTWQPAETAPKDGTRFWGRVDDDAIAMFWHPHFGEFISSCREMVMANGWAFEDGSKSKLHSPEVHKPTGWMPLPATQEPER
jgi:uncharacterized protein YqjF (DUF2071 family)